LVEINGRTANLLEGVFLDLGYCILVPKTYVEHTDKNILVNICSLSEKIKMPAIYIKLRPYNIIPKANYDFIFFINLQRCDI